MGRFRSAALADLEGVHMSDAVYRKTEIVGTSTNGVDDAIRNGITRARKTLRNLDWYEVTEIRGYIGEGDPEYVQVTMKVGFKLDE
jgi:dodecin